MNDARHSRKKPDQDSRRSGRKRTLLGGKITYADGAHTLDCTIRDVSRTGARIALAKGLGIPSAVYLIDLRNGVAYEANVEWCRPPEFGLAFLKTHPLATLCDPHLYYLKRLWIACAGR